MQDGRIQDDQITASTKFSNLLAPYNARLHKNTTDGKPRAGWAVGYIRPNQPPWIQVDFRKEEKLYQIATQGLSDLPQYVTAYNISYSDDGEKFTPYDKTFAGNSDNNVVKLNWLIPQIKARVVRIYPVSWHHWLSMRLEFYGCEPQIGQDVKK